MNAKTPLRLGKHDSLTHTYQFPPEWLSNATSAARLQGPGEWAIETGPQSIRNIVAGRVKHLDARRYTGPVEDASAKSGMRHSYEHSRAEVIDVQTPTTGSVIVTLRYEGKSAKAQRAEAGKGARP